MGTEYINSKKTSVTVSCFALSLILLAGAIPVFFLTSSSAASSVTFSSAINLSNDANKAEEPTVSNNGQSVYVAWTEGSKGIFFRVSSNGGSSWTPPTMNTALKLSNKGGTAEFPVMFTQYQEVSSGDVYVTWAQTVTQTNGSKVLQIFIAVSTNNGKSFSTTQLSHNATNSQNTPAIAAWGNDVFVSWFSAKNSTGSGSIYVTSSTNNGQTWSAPVDVVNPCRNGESEIVASGSNVYVVSDGIDFTASYNSGATWSPQVQLFQAPFSYTSIYYGREPWIAAFGNVVNVVWEANSTTPGISYHDQGRTSTDGGVTWGPTQNITDPLKDNWEPENVAYGTNVFLTFHSLGTQGVYATSAIDVNSETPTWTTPVLLSSTKLTSSYGHIFTSDGVNIFVFWGQQISSGSSTWAAYVAYSTDSGSKWSSPVNISHNSRGVAAGNQDVTLFALSSNGAHCFATWTYVSGSMSQIYFSHS